MENKTAMKESKFRKEPVVLQRLMGNFSNRLLLAYCCLPKFGPN